jgi:hypothetical protein
MQIKPFRAYDENDVLNIYSLAEASGNAGDLVQYQSLNPSDWDGYDMNNNLAPFPGMSIPLYVNKAKVAQSTSGSTTNVLGMAIWNTRQSDPLGRPLIYTPDRYMELHVVTSGQTLPVLKRGMVFVSGYEGTANAGSGIAAGDGGLGAWKVVGKDVTPNLGKWLSQSGADGYALAYLNVQ